MPNRDATVSQCVLFLGSLRVEIRSQILEALADTLQAMGSHCLFHGVAFMC